MTHILLQFNILTTFLFVENKKVKSYITAEDDGFNSFDDSVKDPDFIVNCKCIYILYILYIILHYNINIFFKYIFIFFI